MAKLPKSQAKLVPLLLLFLFSLRHSSAAYSIGVNYGTVANNLPPPSQVANFLKTQTTIDRVKIFDANPDILKAFANTKTNITKIWKILPSGGTSEPFEGKKPSWEY